MQDSDTGLQEGTDKSIIDDITQLENFSLGEGAATCLVCGSFLREGEPVVVYVFRPAGEVAFQVGYVLCDDDQDAYSAEFTLGVRELIIEGRIGWCSDEATQSSWPVLLAPKVLGVSAAATKSLRKCVTSEDHIELNTASGECEVGR
ncbi:hypothetical protein CYV19_15930 [Natronobacterium gregoryi SP2]|uniref:DUF8112 domain-containing protein n=1 Tax=Natronobacterium gregoryi (strain ATCC 43098 / DSM 3393 / CCM 3738 / CIP 104747 / IAM 13177 / JCM 8860 / NBRC 102187 / NCIMB 2189 / SP2) TaxID=797304 RepID=L0AK10_NATGS|nr:hypothetical protein Natgr_2640 [Natronobacterium gregoryi SP2]ELY65275.1 hypothetical protein C490_13740 [Natronobacterium gregoryi SP2]PLK19233.1 hypothetical protein CYV19_15930 [Natronobacterium gregoryi SP2]